MANPPSDKLPPFDLQHCIELLCGHKKPSFPFEDYHACMQFNCWLRFPDSKNVQRQAGLMATALIINALEKRKLRPRASGDLSRLKTMLRQYPFERYLWSVPMQRMTGIVSFNEAFEKIDLDVSSAVMIADFLVRCPAEHDPSLNKAMAVIAGGGMVAKDAPADIRHYARPSISKLKQNWGDYAPATPFYLAAEESDEWDFSAVIDMAPDDPSSIERAKPLLRSRTTFCAYFTIARGYQDALVSHLNKRSRDRFSFASFPSSIESIDLDLEEPLDSDQVDILHKYGSPKAT